MKDEQIYSRLLDKQEQMANDIGEIKVILARQEESLRYHIKRTDLAEENIALTKEHTDKVIQKIEKDMEPIKNHVILVNNVLRVCGAIAAVASFIAAVSRILGLFS